MPVKKAAKSCDSAARCTGGFLCEFEVKISSCEHTFILRNTTDVSCHCTVPNCRGRDRMVVGFTTTYAISAYHH